MVEAVTRVPSHTNGLTRLQRRVRNCIDELNKVAESLSANPTSMYLATGIDADRLERDCICLEVALDEASKCSKAILSQIKTSAALTEPPASVLEAFLNINSLLTDAP